MPQLQSIVLTDRATTPVNHTFTPRGIDPKTGIASVALTSGVPVGWPTLTISLKDSSRFRAKIVLQVPVTQTVTDGTGKSTTIVVRTASAFLDFVFDETSTEQERNDLVGMLASALATGKTLVNDTVVKLEGVY